MLSLPVGLFGCKAKKTYTAADVSIISFSCSSMNYSDSYAFSLEKADDEWLFDAGYSYDYENPRVEFAYRMLRPYLMLWMSKALFYRLKNISRRESKPLYSTAADTICISG